MNSRYDLALRSARRSKKPSRRVYELLLTAHEQGDARATYALATWYLHGSPFTPVDHTRGIKMLRMAAKKRIPDAMYDLAASYEEGKGVKKNESQAFELYMRAALWGESQSFYEVGRMYYYGIGTSMNRRLARIWMDKAAELGVKD